MKLTVLTMKMMKIELAECRLLLLLVLLVVVVMNC